METREIRYKNGQKSNLTTYISENAGIPIIKFPLLDNIEFIQHGFSTRLGGVSNGIYSSMNLNFTRGDREDDVLNNFRKIASALDTKVENMVYAMQTHTNHVLKVGRKQKGMGIIRQRDFSDIDGLITNEPGICLVTSYADCVPLYFVDIVKKCIGLSHSGWRGTVENIGRITVEKMTKEYGSNPKDIMAVIGPCICVDCYEVGEDVAQRFEKAYKPQEQREIIYPKANQKFHLDLCKANYFNMISAGIQPEHISISDLCTCCNPDLLFSHRASKGQRGGLCGFLEIKPL